FDSERLEIGADPMVVAERIGGSSTSYAGISVSQTGTLAYAGAIREIGQLTWFDRSGSRLGAVSEEGDYIDFRLSPDDRRLLASRVNPKAGNPDIWMIDLTRGSSIPFALDAALDASALWSPDGTRVAFR